MSASTLTIRMDDELKRSAADVAEYYGLDLSSVVRAVFKQMVNTGRIPLTFAPEEPNGESLNAAAEADSFMASGKTTRKFLRASLRAWVKTSSLLDCQPW